MQVPDCGTLAYPMLRLICSYYEDKTPLAIKTVSTDISILQVKKGLILEIAAIYDFVKMNLASDD